MGWAPCGPLKNFKNFQECQTEKRKTEDLNQNARLQEKKPRTLTALETLHWCLVARWRMYTYIFIYVYIDLSTVTPNSDASAYGRGVFVGPVFGPRRSIVLAKSELFNSRWFVLAESELFYDFLDGMCERTNVLPREHDNQGVESLILSTEISARNVALRRDHDNQGVESLIPSTDWPQETTFYLGDMTTRV